ncbi:MAG: SipW-dependent-type signal peptide-containing protein, partial [Bacilli bacterium]|nr:SipW-dependent-type signal peptide-containing protein [Bacilli bacterium]
KMEENRKGPGVFYAVVGVATLVVAIIGATFAYFSASAQAETPVTGGTNNDLASALSVKVTRVKFAGVDASINDNLVPARLDDTSKEGVNKALTAKCVNSGYTGCHVWKIEANTTQELAEANVLLNLSVTATTKNNWKYLVYKGTDSAATEITTAATPLSTAATDVDLHKKARLTPGNADTAPSVTYYLMVYLAENGKSQNTTENQGADETGQYNGTVTMKAAGGQVTASFMD